MVLDDGKRDRKGHRTSSKDQKPSLSHSIFVPLFGFRPRPGASTRDKGRDKGRDRPDVRRDREDDRNRERDRKRDQDRDRERRYRQHAQPPQTRPRHTPPPPPATTTPAPKRITVRLFCLDHRYQDLRIHRVKLDSPVTDLEHKIRRRYEDWGIPLERNALFRFYSSDTRELRQEDLIKDYDEPIWYRVSRSAGPALEEWKFDHYRDKEPLPSALADELAREIDAGATVAQLRRKVADYDGIDDPREVVLIARGGMRPGSLKGESWVVREIKDKWMCRWISVDTMHRRQYVVLKGLKREYIYHPDKDREKWNPERDMLILELKTDMVRKLFQQVRQFGKTNWDLGWKRIALSRNGKPVSDRAPVRWGAEFTFEIPDDAAEVFAAEETWLLPTTESCMVCIEDKKITELPIRVTADCNHPPTTCKDCLKQWLQSSLETGTWDRLKCPECPSLLKHADVARYASAPIFTRYDTLATRAAVKEIPNFRWCLSPSCSSGQIDDETCPKFKCDACSSRHCTTHNVPWHKGETCDEYDRRNRKRAKDDKASEDMIKKTSKKCPECKQDVHKWTGCNHITCRCGHEWCYICFAKFERNQVGFLFCRHNPDCTERDPFIDLIDNPQNVANGQGGNGMGPGRWRPAGGPPRFPPHLFAAGARRPTGARVGQGPMRNGMPPRVPPAPAWAGPGMGMGPQAARPRQAGQNQAAQGGQQQPPLFVGVAAAADIIQNGFNGILNDLQNDAQNGLNHTVRHDILLQGLRQTARTLEELRRLQL